MAHTGIIEAFQPPNRIAACSCLLDESYPMQTPEQCLKKDGREKSSQPKLCWGCPCSEDGGVPAPSSIAWVYFIYFLSLLSQIIPLQPNIHHRSCSLPFVPILMIWFRWAFKPLKVIAGLSVHSDFNTKIFLFQKNAENVSKVFLPYEARLHSALRFWQKMEGKWWKILEGILVHVS